MSPDIPCISDVGEAHDGSLVLAAGATRRGPPQVIPPRVTELMRVCLCRPYVDDPVRLILDDRHLTWCSSIVLPFSLFYSRFFLSSLSITIVVSVYMCVCLHACVCVCVCDTCECVCTCACV